jgi:hypothetical protein
MQGIWDRPLLRARDGWGFPIAAVAASWGRPVRSARKFAASPLACLLFVLLAVAPVAADGFGRTSSRRGVYWTIQCMELRGPGCRQDAERIAASLGNTQGIKRRKVVTLHEPHRSRVFYGKYLRKPDRQTGKFKIPDDMKRDSAMIKQLSGPEGGRFFFDSRPIPVPTPNVGDPAWRLENNPGTYSLRIAVFFDEPGFYERKQAAADYCEELRKKGYEAYYRHSQFVSEVFVGSFGPEARIKGRKFGVVAYFNSAEVQQLQLKEKGQFRFELWNMKVRSMNTGGGSRDRRVGRRDPNPNRIAYLSRLFPVREKAEQDEFEY